MFPSYSKNLSMFIEGDGTAINNSKVGKDFN